MDRNDKHGGVTWVAVKDMDDHKVRCRACSSVMYPRKWWTHKCQDTLVEDKQSKSSLQESQSNEEESGDI